MDSADAGQLSAAQIAQIQYQLLQQQQYQCQHIESTAVAQNSTTSDGTAPAPSQRLSPEQIHYLQQAQLSQQHQQQQLESPMTHPVVSQIVAAISQITVQLQATQSRLHSIVPQLTSLQKELQSNSQGQHTQRMEAEYRAVASAYEQHYRLYALYLQQIQQLQTSLQQHQAQQLKAQQIQQRIQQQLQLQQLCQLTPQQLEMLVAAGQITQSVQMNIIQLQQQHLQQQQKTAHLQNDSMASLATDSAASRPPTQPRTQRGEQSSSLPKEKVSSALNVGAKAFEPYPSTKPDAPAPVVPPISTSPLQLASIPEDHLLIEDDDDTSCSADTLSQ